MKIIKLERGQILNLNLLDVCIEDSADLEVYCAENSSFNFKFLIKNSFDMNIKIYLERGSTALVKGAYILSGDSKVVLNTQQVHNGPNSKSELVIKGVLDDNSKAEYIGKIFVDREACLTNASQENKNIILSPNAKAYSIPSLEVLTDDVKCKHATASSYIDTNQMFYLESRGLDFAACKAMILDAFLKDVL